MENLYFCSSIIWSPRDLYIISYQEPLEPLLFFILALALRNFG